MRSGVEAPERKPGEVGDGGARPVVSEIWKVAERWLGDLGIPIVVLRCRFVVSEDGGGGRWPIDIGESIEARQRKHSPVPK